MGTLLDRARRARQSPSSCRDDTDCSDGILTEMFFQNADMYSLQLVAKAYNLRLQNPK